MAHSSIPHPRKEGGFKAGVPICWLFTGWSRPFIPRTLPRYAQGSIGKNQREHIELHGKGPAQAREQRDDASEQDEVLGDTDNRIFPDQAREFLAGFLDGLRVQIGLMTESPGKSDQCFGDPVQGVRRVIARFKPEVQQVAGHGLGIPADQAGYQFEEVLAEIRRQLFGEAEIQEDDLPSGFVTRDGPDHEIPRVWVGVEEAVNKDLLTIRFGEALHDLPSVETRSVDGFSITDLHA